MQRCSICQTANRLGSRYCNACGAPFAPPVTCPACGAAMPPVFRHCGLCGADLIAEAALPAIAAAAALAASPVAPEPILATDAELPAFEADVPPWPDVVAASTRPDVVAASTWPDVVAASTPLAESPAGDLPRLSLPDWLFPPERELPDWLCLPDLPEWLFEPEPRPLPDWLFLVEGPGCAGGTGSSK